MPKQKSPFITVSVRMPAELHGAVSKLAESDRRKISEWIRLVVEKEVGVRTEKGGK